MSGLDLIGFDAVLGHGSGDHRILRTTDRQRHGRHTCPVREVLKRIRSKAILPKI